MLAHLFFSIEFAFGSKKKIIITYVDYILYIQITVIFVLSLYKIIYIFSI